MENNKEILRVNMFGMFSLQYKDSIIATRKNVVTKSMQLLQLLLYYGEKGIARNELIEDIFGREDITDPANNLRVAIFRLRKMLLTEGLPDEDYIVSDNGRYFWRCSMPLEMDVHIFEACMNKAAETEDEDERVELLERACNLYRGDFLSKLSGTPWVIVESIRFKQMFTAGLKEIFEYQRRHEMYDEMLVRGRLAANMYPFDEWQSIEIEALMHLSRDEEAMKVYQKTSRLLFEEFGVSPSEKMMKQFEKMSTKLQGEPKDIQEIKVDLKEKESKQGAFFCTLPSFIDGYRLLSRMAERNGFSVFLMLATITDGNGNAQGNDNKLKPLAESFKATLGHTLRKGDAYTQYSQNQFLIMLPSINKEDCDIVSKRILDKFSEEHKHWKNYICFSAASMIDIEGEGDNVRFHMDKTID